MKISRVAFSAWILVWAIISYVGIRLFLGVLGQGVPGYPNVHQMTVYVILPISLAVANFLVVIYAQKLPLWALLIAFFGQLLVLPVFVIIGGGGV